MLELSIVLNVVLGAALLFALARARQRVVEEKCSTFAGCLAAITSGLAIEDVDRRFNAVAHGFASLYKRSDQGEEQMRFYLTRASMLRVFRQAALADIGEHLRLLALRTAGEDDEPGNQMLEYISQAQPGDKEPREIWGDDDIATAEFVAERKALAIYEAQMTAAIIKVLG